MTLKRPQVVGEVVEVRVKERLSTTIAATIKAVVKEIYGVVFLLLWIMGFTVAKGFISTLCCICPLWAWYLAIEHLDKVLTHVYVCH